MYTCSEDLDIEARAQNSWARPGHIDWLLNLASSSAIVMRASRCGRLDAMTATTGLRHPFRQQPKILLSHFRLSCRPVSGREMSSGLWHVACSVRFAVLQPHAGHSTSVSPRQSLGDLGRDRERPAPALRALHPFLSREQPMWRSRGSCVPCSANFAATSSSSGTAAAFTRGPMFVPCSHPMSAVAHRAFPRLCPRPEPGRVRLDPLQGHAQRRGAHDRLVPDHQEGAQAAGTPSLLYRCL